MEAFSGLSKIFKREKITSNSTKEDVSQFFLDKYKITEKAKENIIKENITGETLTYLEDHDYTFLGISPDIKDKIKKYLESNKKNFKLEPIKFTLNLDSNKTEVIDFCKKYLSFEYNLNDDINGKKLLSLSEKEMKKIGLSFAQRKKLLNYIKQLNISYKEELKNY